MPDNASRERIDLIEAFGAEIVFSEGAKGTNGSVAMAQELAARPAVLHAVPVRESRRTSWPTTTEPGRRSSRTFPTSRHSSRDSAPAGRSWASARGSRNTTENVKIVAAEPELGELVYGLRSLDDGYIPPIFDPEAIDGKVKVGARDSILWTRELLQKEGIFAGISAGAVIWVAQRVAERLSQNDEGGDIVCLLADGGWKYLSTEAWTQDIDTAESQVEEVLWW